MKAKVILMLLIIIMSISIVSATSIDENNNNTFSPTNINEITENDYNAGENNQYENEIEKNKSNEIIQDENNTLDSNTTQTNNIEETKSPTTYYVNINTGNDSNPGTQTQPFRTFEYAITKTHDNDKLILADGTYTLTKLINISYSLNITGTSRTNTILKCHNKSSFNITGGNFRINTMTFRNGINSGYGGVFITQYSTNFYAYNVLFENNTGKRGGVIYNVADQSNLILTNCIFRNNKGVELGGAVCTSGSENTVTVTNCSFTNNRLNYTPLSASSIGSGGAIYSGGSDGNVMTVVNSNFTLNIVKNSGGGIYSGNMAELVVRTSRFNNNTAYYNSSYEARGGAIAVGGESLNVTSSNFTNNYAFTGGAIAVNSGKNLNIYLCKFTTNNAKNWSGAVYMYATSNISNSNFTSNSAGKRGGALLTQQSQARVNITNSIFNGNYINNTGEVVAGAFAGNAYKGQYIIRNSTFLNNNASSGGAIYLTGERSKLYVYSSTFNGNYVTSTGGTLYNIASKATIEFHDSIIKNEYSDKYGGAFGLRGNDSEYIFDNVTMTNNKVNGYGGAIYMDKGDLTLIKSIIKNNIAVKTTTAPKPGWGGAVYIQYAYATSIEQTIIQHNNAECGGAIYLNDGSSSGKQYMNVSQLYNNTNKSIYSPNIFFNATRNWWGKNNGNTTINTRITGTNNISVSEPIVLKGSITTKHNQTTGKTTIRSQMSVKYYNSSGSLKLLDQFIDKIGIRYKLVNRNTNTVLVDTTFNLTGEKTFTHIFDGDLTTIVYFNATIDNQTITITPSSTTATQQTNTTEDLDEIIADEEYSELDIIDDGYTIENDEYGIVDNVEESNYDKECAIIDSLNNLVLKTNDEIVNI